jgi:hypothetical protein
MNSLTDQVVVIKIALSDHFGKEKIFLSSENQGDHRMTIATGDVRQAEVVTVMTLDNCLRQNPLFKPPYLIKIDVQGHEIRILSGADSTLRQPVLICMEVWPWALQLVGDTLADLEVLRTKYNFSAYRLHKTYLEPVPELQKFSESLPTHKDFECEMVLTNLDVGNFKVVVRA